MDVQRGKASTTMNTHINEYSHKCQLLQNDFSDRFELSVRLEPLLNEVHGHLAEREEMEPTLELRRPVTIPHDAVFRMCSTNRQFAVHNTRLESDGREFSDG